MLTLSAAVRSTSVVHERNTWRSWKSRKTSIVTRLQNARKFSSFSISITYDIFHFHGIEYHSFQFSFNRFI